MSLPEQFEVHDRRVAADGAAYTYSDFEQWYGAHAKQMWEGAAATEHRRVAADGAAYTYADFEQWYGAHARQMWEGAAATEHRHNRTSQSIQQMLRIAADGRWYSTHAELLWESATATEHSGRIDIQALPPRSQASHPTGVTVRASALPRDVTEHSPLDNITTDPATPAPTPALAPTPAPTPALDRPDWCERCGNKGVCDSCKRSHEQAQSPLASTEQWDIPPTATLISRNIPGPPTGPPPGPPTTDPATPAPAPALAPTPAPTPALDRPDWCERCGNKGVCDSCKRSHEQAQSPLASTEQWDIPPTATLISRNIPGPPTGPPPGPPGRGGQQPGCNATEHADSLQCYRACTGS